MNIKRTITIIQSAASGVVILPVSIDINLQSCAKYLRKIVKILNISPFPKLQCCRKGKTIQNEAKNMCHRLLLLSHGFG